MFCVSRQTFFKSSHLLQFLSGFHETWHTWSTCQYTQNCGTDFRNFDLQIFGELDLVSGRAAAELSRLAGLCSLSELAWQQPVQSEVDSSAQSQSKQVGLCKTDTIWYIFGSLGRTPGAITTKTWDVVSGADLRLCGKLSQIRWAVLEGMHPKQTEWQTANLISLITAGKITVKNI